jgi:hypothetical protein
LGRRRRHDRKGLSDCSPAFSCWAGVEGGLREPSLSGARPRATLQQLREWDRGKGGKLYVHRTGNRSLALNGTFEPQTVEQVQRVKPLKATAPPMAIRSRERPMGTATGAFIDTPLHRGPIRHTSAASGL